MSLLQDARTLADSTPVYAEKDDGISYCHYCDAPIHNETRQPLGPHAAHCPWLSMPKIVAALEAAERIADMNPVNQEHVCTYCDDVLYSHEDDCAHAILVAALAPDA